MIKIFVEGSDDEKFLKDFLSVLYKKTDCEIIKTDGWTNIKNRIFQNKMAENTDMGGINLIVFDADENFSDRLNKVQSFTAEYNCEIFLFPNNKDSGNLETLLESISQSDNKFIFKCWYEYENCLRSSVHQRQSGKLFLPDHHAKIYAYNKILSGKSERNFTNKKLWDLNSNNLIPLKIFLDRFFSLNQI